MDNSDALLAAVTASNLRPHLAPLMTKAARAWGGEELRLHPIRGGYSADCRVATEMADRNHREKPWGFHFGGRRSFMLARREGERLRAELDRRGITYSTRRHR